MVASKLEDQAVRQRVQDALPGLTEQQRECLRLVYGLDGSDQARTGAEVARRMSISYSRFKQVHRRAIARIAPILIFENLSDRQRQCFQIFNASLSCSNPNKFS